jgi:cyclopropane-fatty-acyl-phospholipid synthase
VSHVGITRPHQVLEGWRWAGEAAAWRDRAASALDRHLLQLLARGLSPAPIRVVLWDETGAGPKSPVATVRLGTRRAQIGVILDPDMAFGDLYATGGLEVEGDLPALLEEIYRLHPRLTALRGAWRRARGWANTETRARRQIHHHYDIGNKFYRLWLDEQMQYTCAYFPKPEVSLENAQLAKLDHVCRKLDLRPGERVVEAGCGWGGLALHMARHYGVTVTAYNISAEQVAYAKRAAEAAGLVDRVTFVEDDFRNIRDRAGVFVSVGMLEHLGTGQYEALASVIDRTLDPCRGRGLLHFIGRNRPMPLHPWIERRIFPGAYVPSLAEVLGRITEPLELSVVDVENLRLHYAKTLEHWLARYERTFDTVVGDFDECFARAWRLYLAGSVASFRTGAMQLFQVTFARGSHNGMPWTRAGLYRTPC